jgi:hypothetical protein
MRQVIKDEKPVSAEKPARSSVYTRGDDLKTASTRVDDPGYARRFPEKEARRSALKAKSAGRARSLSARHPARGAGYRK